MVYKKGTLQANMADYVDKLHISDDEKKQIYNVYLNYLDIICNKFSSYESGIAKQLVNKSNQEFKSRVICLIQNKDNKDTSYVRFISKNKYKFNGNLLKGVEKNYYEKIKMGEFNITEQALLYPNANYLSVKQTLYYLAKKFGYNDLDVDDKTEPVYTDDKVPDVIKNAIKNVE